METNEVWLAIDKYGRETISPCEPSFDGFEWDYSEEIECEYNVSFTTSLPDGFIKKVIGRELTFEESPIKIQ